MSNHSFLEKIKTRNLGIIVSFQSQEEFSIYNGFHIVISPIEGRSQEYPPE
jgi:hypothetical protein